MPCATAGIRQSKERIQTTEVPIAEYMKENPNIKQAHKVLKKARSKEKQKQKTKIEKQKHNKKKKKKNNKSKDILPSKQILTPITQWFCPTKRKLRFKTVLSS